MKTYAFKVIIVGGQRVGKSALLKQMSLGEPLSEAEMLSEFDDQQGADGSSKDMKKKEYKIDNDSTVILEVWDAVGYGGDSITSQFYRESVGVILVYDSTACDSLEELRPIEDKCRDVLKEFECVTCFLVANKIDDADSDPQNITYGEQYKNRHRDMYSEFFQVSANCGTNVDKMFQQMAEVHLDRHKRGAIQPVRHSDSVVVLRSTGSSPASQKSNCDC